MKIRELFDRYGWIIAALALVIVVIGAVYGRPAFCATDEEHCLREWISSLSGWATVLVAVPTIIFLQRQISDANRHQRENIEISLMPKFALVIRVRHLVGFEQTSLILELRRYAKRGDNIGRYPMDRQGLGEICRQIKALLAEHDLIEFNATIAGEPKLTRYWIDRKTDDLYQNVVECDRDARDPSGLGQHKLNHHGTTIHVALVMLLDCVERYLLDRDEQARAFLVRWNQPAAEPWKSW